MHYNVVGNDKRDMFEKHVNWTISSQAPKGYDPTVKVQRLTDSPPCRVQVHSKWEPPLCCMSVMGVDIVWSVWKHAAAGHAAGVI